MKEQLKAVIRRINAVGARYTVHDETGRRRAADSEEFRQLEGMKVDEV